MWVRTKPQTQFLCKGLEVPTHEALRSFDTCERQKSKEIKDIPQGCKLSWYAPRRPTQYTRSLLSRVSKHLILRSNTSNEVSLVVNPIRDAGTSKRTIITSWQRLIITNFSPSRASVFFAKKKVEFFKMYIFYRKQNKLTSKSW